MRIAYFKKMDSYIVKIDSDGVISLQSADQQSYPVSHLLHLHPGRNVFAFEGAMGAGKTTIIKQLCEELGTTDVVNSPTFAIVNVYDIPRRDGSAGSEEVYHFDCYRLKETDEARDMGAEEYLYSGCLCLVEWPEIISALLPEDTVHINISTTEDGERVLTTD